MAKRRVTYRAETSELQGEGSWIELSFITRNEAKNAPTGDDKIDALLKKHVIGWNWKDDEGNDLEVDTMELFSHERVSILDKLFNPSKEDLKNSETG